MYSNYPEVDGTKDSFNDVPILVLFLELFICFLPQDDYLYIYICIIGIILINAFM